MIKYHIFNSCMLIKFLNIISNFCLKIHLFDYFRFLKWTGIHFLIFGHGLMNGISCMEFCRWSDDINFWVLISYKVIPVFRFLDDCLMWLRRTVNVPIRVHPIEVYVIWWLRTQNLYLFLFSVTHLFFCLCFI